MKNTLKRIELSSTNIAAPIAEVCISARSLADDNHQSSLLATKYYDTNANGAGSPDAGRFVGMIDTESMQPHSGDSLYSGISTLGSVVQLVGDSKVSSSVDKNFKLLGFAQFTMALTLDLNGTGTYVVSI